MHRQCSVSAGGSERRHSSINTAGRRRAQWAVVGPYAPHSLPCGGAGKEVGRGRVCACVRACARERVHVRMCTCGRARAGVRVLGVRVLGAEAYILGSGWMFLKTQSNSCRMLFGCVGRQLSSRKPWAVR